MNTIRDTKLNTYPSKVVTQLCFWTALVLLLICLLLNWNQYIRIQRIWQKFLIGTIILQLPFGSNYLFTYFELVQILVVIVFGLAKPTYQYRRKKSKKPKLSMSVIGELQSVSPKVIKKDVEVEYLKSRKALNKVSQIEFIHGYFPHVLFCLLIMVVDLHYRVNSWFLTAPLLIIFMICLLIILLCIYYVKDQENYRLWKKEKGTMPRTAFIFEIRQKIQKKLTKMDAKQRESRKVGTILSQIKEESEPEDNGNNNSQNLPESQEEKLNQDSKDGKSLPLQQKDKPEMVKPLHTNNPQAEYIIPEDDEVGFNLRGLYFYTNRNIPLKKIDSMSSRNSSTIENTQNYGELKKVKRSHSESRIILADDIKPKLIQIRDEENKNIVANGVKKIEKENISAMVEKEKASIKLHQRDNQFTFEQSQLEGRKTTEIKKSSLSEGKSKQHNGEYLQKNVNFEAHNLKENNEDQQKIIKNQEIVMLKAFKLPGKSGVRAPKLSRYQIFFVKLEKNVLRIFFHIQKDQRSSHRPILTLVHLKDI